ncbi:TetR/AcrR family transcriptional regulator [Phaeobacter porticola]|uniref:Transcriptional regulator, TetR family n=1 Tax=Phaeobacter porticola TaxID=1844006 RepID=A0A1L3I5R9_9RHOB|nr:TetR/AcrR family transcriptional regulator [Phaeobacter porticola]APG47448.1 transcriptional regulator, TetR family [Phaeobacter porticola]
MDARLLTPEDWLDLALQELKAHGYNALRAQPLANKLSVTRGSFYHHFESLEVFHAAVIAHWAKMTSGQIALAAQDIDDATEALDDLLQKTLCSGEALERAIRSWSTVKPMVAEAVERIDQERIDIAETLLCRTGLPKSVSLARAKLLYWAAIGRLMLPFPQNNVLSRVEISDLAALMSTKSYT